MVFNSSVFVYFFIVVLGVYWALGRLRAGNRAQNLFLLLSSYFFYGWWDWVFLSLIFVSTITDYFAARGIESAQSDRRRRAFLFVSIAVNLGLLGTFKYFDFFAKSFIAAVRTVNPEFNEDESSWIFLNLVLPVGISFYTFQTMSYTIDVYRKVIPSERNFLDFALFVSFFPQLVAGPIERAADLLPQLKADKRLDMNDVASGVWLILLGFFMKVYVADSLGPLVNTIYLTKDVYESNPELAADHGGLHVIIASVGFAFQIYCDFAGYSTIAMGTARLLGVRLTLNFDTPEFSQNPTELWRRWHTTLNRWLRDYVYIPLGGSHYGPVRQQLNLFVAFVLTGLWHGANWTFVLWGAFMGAWIIAHSVLKPYLPRLSEDAPLYKVVPARAAKMIAVYGTFGLSATFFRAYDIEHTAMLWASILDFPWQIGEYERFFGLQKVPAAGDYLWSMLTKVFVLLLIDWMWYRKDSPYWIFQQKLPVRVLVYSVLFFAIIVLGAFGKDVIYFAF